jgi:hypothetical protein
MSLEQDRPCSSLLDHHPAAPGKAFNTVSTPVPTACQQSVNIYQHLAQDTTNPLKTTTDKDFQTSTPFMKVPSEK